MTVGAAEVEPAGGPGRVTADGAVVAVSRGVRGHGAAGLVERVVRDQAVLVTHAGVGGSGTTMPSRSLSSSAAVTGMTVPWRGLAGRL